MKAAKESIPTSTFYRRYPSKLSERATKRVRKWHFENLLQVVAVGFDPTSELLYYIEKDYNDGGVLICGKKYRECVLEYVCKLNKTLSVILYY